MMQGNIIWVCLSVLHQSSVLCLQCGNFGIIHVEWNILLRREVDKAIKKIVCVNGHRKAGTKRLDVEVRRLKFGVCGVCVGMCGYVCCGILPLRKGQTTKSVSNDIVSAINKMEGGIIFFPEYAPTPDPLCLKVLKCEMLAIDTKVFRSKQFIRFAGRMPSDSIYCFR
jgi:hypothetical protein